MGGKGRTGRTGGGSDERSAARVIESHELEPRQRAGRVLQMRVAVPERRQDRIEVCQRPPQAIASGGERGFDRVRGLREMPVVGAGALRASRTADAVARCLEQGFGRLEHRVVGRRAAGAGRREDQKSRELGRHVAQVFEMGTGSEDVSDRRFVERLGHGPHCTKQRAGDVSASGPPDFLTSNL